MQPPRPTEPQPDPCAPLLERALALVEDRTFAAVRGLEGRAPRRASPIGHMPIYVPRPLLEAIGCLPVARVRRGGADRHHPRRLLLPVLHLPHPAQHPRARADRPPRRARRHALPVDLRRDPQPRRHVEDAVPGALRGLRRPARRTSSPRSAGASTPSRCASCARARGARRASAHRGRRCARPSPREPAARAPRRARRAAPPEPWRVRAPRPTSWCAPARCCARASTPRCSRASSPPRRRRAARVFDNVRVVMVGSFCEQPPFELIRTLERAGCDIVDDDFQLGLRMIEAPIDVAGGRGSGRGAGARLPRPTAPPPRRATSARR